MLLCGRAWANVIINAEIFPDSQFRFYVKTDIDDGDGILSDEEIEYIYDISVNFSGIFSLKGIEYFTELITLECEGNSLAELDVPASLTSYYSVFGEQTVSGQVLSVSADDSYPYQFNLSKIITSSENLSHVTNL